MKHYLSWVLMLFLLFVRFVGNATEADNPIDSLNQLLDSQKGNQRILTLIDLGTTYYTQGDYAASRTKLNEAIRLAKSNKQPKKIIDATYVLGLVELSQSNYVPALTCFFQVEKYYSTTKDTALLASIYNDLGVVYFRMADYDNAINYYKKALKMNEKLQLKSGVSANLTNIGGIYYIQGKMKKAIEYCFKSLQLERETGNKKGEISSLTTIAITYEATKDTVKAKEYYYKSCRLAEQIKDRDGMAYSYLNFGNFFANQSQPSKALFYHQKSLYLFDLLGDKSGVAQSLSGIGNVYLLQEKYDKAITILLKAYRLNEEIHYNEGLLKTTNLLSRTYFAQGSLDVALQFANRGLLMAKEANNIEEIVYAHKVLSDVYLQLNQAKPSLYHFQRTVTIKDSLMNLEMQTNIAEIQGKYHSEIQKKENKELLLANKIQSLELTKTNYFNTLLLVGIAFLILISYWLLKRTKLKHEREEMVLMQKMLRLQMNPHFLFNALSAIESFIYQNEPREAGGYLSKFAQLMRLILENSREEYITLEKELQTLTCYFNLQQLRYDQLFVYTLVVDDTIDVDLVVIPPMLAQPFIENAIEHGLKQRGSKGEITIRFSRINEELVFEIADNGVGLSTTLESKKADDQHVSLATGITLERLKILNRMKRKKIKWILRDRLSEDGQIIGAQAVFTIPYQKKHVK